MKLLIVGDSRRWAFGHISTSIKRFNQDNSIDITIIYTKEDAVEIAKVTWRKYDIIFLMEWNLYKLFDFIPKNKIITGIHSFCTWDFNLSKGEKVLQPPESLIDYLGDFLRINIISKRLLNLFSKHDLPDIYYTPNGVDCDLFYPKIDMPNKFVAGIIAQPFKKRLKSIDQTFIPSMEKSQIDYKILSGGESTLPYEDMPDFYNSLNCYVCTSRSEGFSMSSLEAGACGRPLISTDVSGTEEMIIPGKTGFIVDQTVEDISDKIDILKNDVEKCKFMGDTMRKHIVENYSWQKVIPYWTSFLKGD